ncbi:hypothetical protein NE570_21010, partial [Eubacterium callanderi]|uniref:hypothetical protein n=2 Tax=Eubacterium callanderi TaxID=53442 RepID=UPI00210B8246
MKFGLVSRSIFFIKNLFPPSGGFLLQKTFASLSVAHSPAGSFLAPCQISFGNLDSFQGAQILRKFFFPFRKISSSSAFASLSVAH